MILENLKKETIESCREIYPRFTLSESSISWPKNENDFYKFLRNNRLDYIVSNNLNNKGLHNKFIDNAIVEMNQYDEILKMALKDIKENSESENWLLIKTKSSYRHFTSDIDVLVNSFTDKKILENKILSKNFLNRQIDKEFMLPIIDIDVQSRISWTKSDEISKDFIWENIRASKHDGVDFLEPNFLLDSLIRIGHMPFEQAEIRLGELMHIYQALSQIDISLLASEAIKCGWSGTYNRIFNLLNDIHKTLYGFDIDGNMIESNISRILKFPYKLSFGMMFMAVVEKRAWNKLWGARYILRDRVMGFIK